MVLISDNANEELLPWCYVVKILPGISPSNWQVGLTDS